MLGLPRDYTGCVVLLYDTNGDYIEKYEASKFDRRNFHMWLRGGVPQQLAEGDICSLLILTEPSPREYKARVIVDNMERVLVLFRGKEKENRNAVRYRVDIPAQITALFRDDKQCYLHTPIDVQMVNISRTGTRIYAPVNALRKNDRITLLINKGRNERTMNVVVANHLDLELYSEYGCALVNAK